MILKSGPAIRKNLLRKNNFKRRKSS